MPPVIRILIASSANSERTSMQTELQACHSFKVVAVTGDIFSALDALRQVKPDVMLLDLEMPGGGSLALVHKVMKSIPLPIIALFSDSADGQVAAAQALAVGAADTQVKRLGDGGLAGTVADLTLRIPRVIQRPAQSKPKSAIPSRQALVSRAAPPPKGPATRKTAGASSVTEATPALGGNTARAIVVGASTGGTQALSVLMERLPANLPGIAIVQHMPPDFTGRLAERLNRRTAVTVVEATEGMVFESGHAYIAPGGMHMALKASQGVTRLTLSGGPLVGGHKPAVEHLFNSLSGGRRGQVMAVMLTGMGNDGAKAMKRLHDQGAVTVAQDEASCVVFGMPREAIRAGAVSHILALTDIPQKIISFGAEKNSSRGVA